MTPALVSRQPSSGRSVRHDGLTRGLGRASAALGVPQLVIPGRFAEGIGIGKAPRHRVVTRIIGVRELAAAAGPLTGPRPAWLWARVGGDAMDLSLMARALRHHDGRGLRRSVITTAGLVVIAAVDLYAAVTRTIRKETATPMELTSTTTVTRPPEEVYAFWQQLDRLPTFMAHLDEVRATGGRRSHWKASAPFGQSVEWDAETTEDVPGQRIAWRSLDGADVPNSGECASCPHRVGAAPRCT